MDWIIEVANIDSPYCNTNNCNYLKWMRKKENTGVTNSLITNVHCFKENFPSSFQQNKHCVTYNVSQFL